MENRNHNHKNDMRIRVKILFVSLFAFMLSSCEDSLDKALRNAGNNRSELEKVLDTEAR